MMLKKLCLWNVESDPGTSCDQDRVRPDTEVLRVNDRMLLLLNTLKVKVVG